MTFLYFLKHRSEAGTTSVDAAIFVPVLFPFPRFHLIQTSILLMQALFDLKRLGECNQHEASDCDGFRLVLLLPRRFVLFTEQI